MGEGVSQASAVERMVTAWVALAPSCDPEAWLVTALLMPPRGSPGWRRGRGSTLCSKACPRHPASSHRQQACLVPWMWPFHGTAWSLWKWSSGGTGGFSSKGTPAWS